MTKGALKKLCLATIMVVLITMQFFYISGCGVTAEKPGDGRLRNYKSLGIEVTSELPNFNFAAVQIETAIKNELESARLLESILTGPVSRTKNLDAYLDAKITEMDFVPPGTIGILTGAVGAKGGFITDVSLVDARTTKTLATWSVEGTMWGGPGSLFGSSFLKGKGEEIAKVCAKELRKADSSFVGSVIAPLSHDAIDLANQASTQQADYPYEPFSEIGNYHALIIGVKDYQYLPDLPTADTDAQAVAAILKHEYGFQVKVLVNPTRAQIITIISGYRKKLTERDNLLIYYAGHGWLDDAEDEGYWLPANAMRDTKVNWVSNSSITTAIRAIRAKHIMIVADSCYSGKLIRGIQLEQKKPGYFSLLARKKARVVLTSGGLEPVVIGGTDRSHSVFTSALVQALRENKDFIDGVGLFNLIRTPVMVNTNQTPEYGDIRKAGHEGGDFVFVRRLPQR